MVKNFYIFRHGQSSYNVEGKIQGHTNNSVLTDRGIDQAYATADNLKNKDVEIVISSPLRRAKQTGNIVSKVIKVPLQYDERFTEKECITRRRSKNSASFTANGAAAKLRMKISALKTAKANVRCVSASSPRWNNTPKANITTLPFPGTA